MSFILTLVILLTIIPIVVRRLSLLLRHSDQPKVTLSRRRCLSPDVIKAIHVRTAETRVGPPGLPLNYYLFSSFKIILFFKCFLFLFINFRFDYYFNSLFNWINVLFKCLALLQRKGRYLPYQLWIEPSLGGLSTEAHFIRDRRGNADNPLLSTDPELFQWLLRTRLRCRDSLSLVNFPQNLAKGMITYYMGFMGQ